MHLNDKLFFFFHAQQGYARLRKISMISSDVSKNFESLSWIFK